jgi:hypothetical protein
VLRSHSGDQLMAPYERLLGDAMRGDPELFDGMPDFVFTAAGPIHVLRDLGHLPFNLGVPEQPPAISGYDVAQVRDGRIAVLYTLVDGG